MFNILKQLKIFLKNRKRARIEKKYKHDIDYIKTLEKHNSHYVVWYKSTWKNRSINFDLLPNLSQVNNLIKSKKKTDYLQIAFIFDLEKDQIIYYKNKWIH